MSDYPRLPARLRNAESPGEGTVFGIPVGDGEYVLAVVTARYPHVIRIGLILEPVAVLPPSTDSFSRSDLEIITQVDASALDDGKWPLVGVIEDFIAAEWPSPPMLPGDRADKAQAPGDLERGLVEAVERGRRRRLRAPGDEGLISVEHDQGSRYAELVLGRGPLFAKMVRDSIDFDSGSFTATVDFIEHEGEWQTGEVDPAQTATQGGWVRVSRNYYERGLVPIVHDFLTDTSHSVVFHYDWLDLPRDAMLWERIETERYGPLEIFPLQIFFRDEGSKRELYGAVGGGDIDEALTQSLIGRTFDPVLNVIFMLDVDISELPPHAHPIDVKGLAELAWHVRGLALRWTSYDGYLIWQPA